MSVNRIIARQCYDDFEALRTADCAAHMGLRVVSIVNLPRYPANERWDVYFEAPHDFDTDVFDDALEKYEMERRKP